MDDDQQPARLPVQVFFYRLYAHEEGDGWGAAEPYLWTIFFKADGSCLTQTPGACFLQGQLEFHFGSGSHGNLSKDSLGQGEATGIPFSTGGWETTLEPIAISLLGKTINIPGLLGIVAVLMEEDALSDSDAEVGHAALNSYLQKGINDFVVGTEFVTGIDLCALALDALKQAGIDAAAAGHPVTDADIKAAAQTLLMAKFGALKDKLADKAKGVVKAAIKGELNIFQKIAAFIDADDMIDMYSNVYTLDDIYGWPREHIGSGSGSIIQWIYTNGESRRMVEKDDDGDIQSDFELFWTVRGFRTWKSLPDNVIPSPKDVQIQCIRTRYSANLKSHYIYEIGGTIDGQPWLIPRTWAEKLITGGEKNFYTGGEGGTKTQVSVQIHEKTKAWYLTTQPNKTKDDNLLSLEQCPFYTEITDQQGAHELWSPYPGQMLPPDPNASFA